jgi:GT2 family glycosyltransferase
MFLTIPTYKKFDLCVQAIESALAGELPPSHILIIDNSGDGSFLHYCDQNGIKLSTDVTVLESNINLGCARAWNLALKNCYLNDASQFVIVANDDIVFHPDTIRLFDEYIKSDPNRIIYCAGGIAAPNAFSLFATRFDRLELTVGLFDEMFKYPYCEDGDMARRIMLYGDELARVPDATVDHVGSATIAAYDEAEMWQHHARFKRNAIYFSTKWGIPDHNDIYSQDGYKIPFNGDEDEEKMLLAYIRAEYGE